MLSSKNGYRFGVDLWALGVITCQLLTGKHPFYHKERKVMMANIHAGYKGLPADYLSAVSPGF
jgi:serine/threonine protein kinase